MSSFIVCQAIHFIALSKDSVFGAERTAHNTTSQRKKAMPKGEYGLNSHFTLILHCCISTAVS